ncbi:MAG TPA: diacylglycerol kinase family protein [Polyangiaceae bacterium]
MRIAVILSTGGSHKSVSSEQSGRIVAQGLSRAGHEATVSLVAPLAAEGAVRAALRSDVRAIVVGGTDEIVSRATNLIADTPKALGVVPLGRSNPLGRALRVPEELEHAVDALGRGTIVRVDVGEVNGRVFAVQAALGLYPWLLRHRALLQRASITSDSPRLRRALWYAVAQQPLISAYMEYNGLLRAVRTPWLAITNTAVADDLEPSSGDDGQDTHRLRLYVGRPRSVAGWLRRLVELAAAGRLSAEALLAGRSDNPGLEPTETRALIVRPRRRRLLVALDGSVELLEAPLRCHVRRAALSVLRPAP